jgi:tRNA (cytidine/uridine-2'-O-)-methyltransferase
MIEIALYQPDIAQNAATIVRLAACVGVRVHIVEPAGFAWSSRDFRRAGMDYVDLADIVRQPDWDAFSQYAHGKRLVLATTSAEQSYTQFRFQPGDILLFGRESSGVPDAVRAQAGCHIKVPMQPGARSLNVAVCAAMITGEAMRQTVWQPA